MNDPVERGDGPRGPDRAPRPSSGLPRAAGALVALAALLLAGTGAADLLWGVEVTLLHGPTSPEEQAEWRRLRDPADDPAEIYGQPEGPPLRVILPAPGPALLHPAEAPGRALLVVDRAGGRAPLQSRTLWRWAATAAGPLLLAGLLLRAAARRRRAAGGGDAGPIGAGGATR